LANGKALGLDCIPSEAPKALENENRKEIFKFINAFLDNGFFFQQWNTNQLVPIPKRAIYVYPTTGMEYAQCPSSQKL
jgi:hypothetical protein